MSAVTLAKALVTTLLRTKDKAESYRRVLEAALGREMSLLKELFEVKQKLTKLTGDKVIPIRGHSASEKGTHHG